MLNNILVNLIILIKVIVYYINYINWRPSCIPIQYHFEISNLFLIDNLSLEIYMQKLEHFENTFEFEFELYNVVTYVHQKVTCTSPSHYEYYLVFHQLTKNFHFQDFEFLNDLFFLKREMASSILCN